MFSCHSSSRETGEVIAEDASDGSTIITTEIRDIDLERIRNCRDREECAKMNPFLFSMFAFFAQTGEPPFLSLKAKESLANHRAILAAAKSDEQTDLSKLPLYLHYIQIVGNTRETREFYRLMAQRHSVMFDSVSASQRKARQWYRLTSSSLQDKYNRKQANNLPDASDLGALLLVGSVADMKRELQEIKTHLVLTILDRQEFRKQLIAMNDRGEILRRLLFAWGRYRTDEGSLMFIANLIGKGIDSRTPPETHEVFSFAKRMLLEDRNFLIYQYAAVAVVRNATSGNISELEKMFRMPSFNLQMIDHQRGLNRDSSRFNECLLALCVRFTGQDPGLYGSRINLKDDSWRQGFEAFTICRLVVGVRIEDMKTLYFEWRAKNPIPAPEVGPKPKERAAP